jgi:hypothetical protein
VLCLVHPLNLLKLCLTHNRTHDWWMTFFFSSSTYCFSIVYLYAGSGFLLKAARRFDIGFAWFNRHFDIEKKPLQSIGLVAGAIVAVVYWTVVVVHHFVI